VQKTVSHHAACNKNDKQKGTQRIRSSKTARMATSVAGAVVCIGSLGSQHALKNLEQRLVGILFCGIAGKQQENQASRGLSSTSIAERGVFGNSTGTK
jgi:hypothetical protein